MARKRVVKTRTSFKANKEVSKLNSGGVWTKKTDPNPAQRVEVFTALLNHYKIPTYIPQ